MKISFREKRKKLKLKWLCKSWQNERILHDFHCFQFFPNFSLKFNFSCSQKFCQTYIYAFVFLVKFLTNDKVIYLHLVKWQKLWILEFWESIDYQIPTPAQQIEKFFIWVSIADQIFVNNDLETFLLSSTWLYTQLPKFIRLMIICVSWGPFANPIFCITQTLFWTSFEFPSESFDYRNGFEFYPIEQNGV